MPDTTRSSPIRGVSRRDFIKYCSYLATLIGMDAYAVPDIANALEKAALKPPVVWTNFQMCTGCTVALLQSTAPDPAVLLLQQISLGFMETAMATTGSYAEKSLEQTLEEGAYWVGEGSVASKMPGAGTTAGKDYGEIAKEIYSKAKGAIAIGSCATFGNCQASNPNPTGAMGIGAYLKGPGGVPDAQVVNLSRCPGNPEDLVATLTYILVNEKLPELDSQGRPTFLYGQLIHDTCERRGHFEAGEFVEAFGDEGSAKKWCLYKVGCKGPVTSAPCGINRWNGRTSWCVAAGGPCTGCAEDNYWDDFQPFNQPVPNVPIPGIAGVPISTIGWGMAGVTAAGLGVHFIGQAVSGRLFKGGPPADAPGKAETMKGGEA